MICVLEGKQRIPAPEGWITDEVPVPQTRMALACRNTRRKRLESRWRLEKDQR